jgi:hypothetical protein
MNQRVLDKSAQDLLLRDWVDKSDQDQVDLEDLLVSLNDDQDGDVELDMLLFHLYTI